MSKKKYKIKEEYPAMVNEPAAVYYTEEKATTDAYEFPIDIVLELADRAVLEVKERKGYTTAEALALIDKEMAWK